MKNDIRGPQRQKSWAELYGQIGIQSTAETAYGILTSTIESGSLRFERNPCRMHSFHIVCPETCREAGRENNPRSRFGWHCQRMCTWKAIMRFGK